MQGTQFWSLVWEDPMCGRAAKPVHLEPAIRDKRSLINASGE